MSSWPNGRQPSAAISTGWARHLPEDPAELRPDTAATDTVILHPDAQVIPRDLADQLARAAGFRNLVVHAYGRLDLQRVHATAVAGPADLRAFLVALRNHADGADPVA